MKRYIPLLAVILLLSTGATVQESLSQEPVSYVSVFDPWVEPVEVCYIIPTDGKKIIKVTSGLVDKIFFVPSIPEMLEQHGYEIKDIQIWIHNHHGPNGFSKDDIIVFWYLKSHGFEGVYLLKTPRGVFYYSANEDGE